MWRRIYAITKTFWLILRYGLEGAHLKVTDEVKQLRKEQRELVQDIERLIKESKK